MLHKNLLSWIVTLLLVIPTASTQVIGTGIIKYERRESSRLAFKNKYGDKPEMMNFIDRVPIVSASIFELYFTPQNSYYEFKERVKNNNTSGFMSFFEESPGSKNKVYRDLTKDSILAVKNFFDAEFILPTHSVKGQWKIESEMRVIAGYNCRKAVTTMFDSLIVVAFYTDEIYPQSGPESIGGLPGMILGLAIPKLYTTWFATEVILTTPPTDKLLIKTKNKYTTTEEMIEKINAATKNWGDYAATLAWTMQI